MDYVEKTREFIADSKGEIRRLEREIDRIRETIVRLERYLDGGPFLKENRPEKFREDERPPAPPEADKDHRPSPMPLFRPFLLGSEKEGEQPESCGNEAQRAGGEKKKLRPVGEVAEEMLRERQEGMSLDELYRVMVERTDIPFSRDLKNAIRVALIRRKPQIVSPRRGWFCWASLSNDR